MSLFKKPYLSFSEQLKLLKSRGLDVTDDTAAQNYLHRLGYYRLSGYWYPFRKPIPCKKQSKKSISKREDQFLPDAKFEDTVNLYVFDKKLRLLIMDAIERIEVAIRVDIAYLLGEYDTFAQHKPEFLHGNFTKKLNPKTGATKYDEWLKRYEQQVLRSKEDFVFHYKEKYGLPLPIWVAIELWDFGLLSVFFSGMNVKDKSIIANRYEISDWAVMESWLRNINYARNVAAHHSRLWNRNLIDQPKLAKVGEMPDFDHVIGKTHSISRVYITLCILTYFLKTICPKSTWPFRLKSLLDELPKSKYINISDMGFPKEWRNCSLWNE